MPKSKDAVAEPEEVVQTSQERLDSITLDTVEEVSFEDELESDSDPVGPEDEEYESPFGTWGKATAAKKPLKVLLYGPAGGGKTRYAATFPDPLFLDLEGGLRSTVDVKDVLRYPKDPNQEIVNVGEVGQFYNIVKAIHPLDAPFKTIVIDSLNELQVLVTKKVVATYDQNRLMEDQLTYQDYGKIGRDVLKIISMFLKLPYNIVFTAVETVREYEGQFVHPRFAGKMIWPELQRWMEQIGYVHVIKGEKGEPEHVVGYRLSPAYSAKSRLKIEQRYLPNHYDALVKYIRSEE
jgi:hypothetical protein